MEKTELEKKQKLFKEKIDEADVVLVGIGEEFSEKFPEIAKFPEIVSMLEKVENDSELEWTVPFLEKCYLDKCQEDKILEAYNNLYRLLKDKNYFILSTCIDEKIHKAGFDKERIVEPCGGYSKLQCSEKCTSDLYSVDECIGLSIEKMYDFNEVKKMSKPVCPNCGKLLVFNNILCESNYVEEGYQPQWEKYTKWLQHTLNKNLCILELGVGMSLPGVIRWPFEKVAFYNKKASFFRINGSLYQMAEELSEKGFSIEKNAVDFLNQIK